MGAAARDKSLVDGLGGVPEAVHRAIQEAGGRFEPAPVLVRSLRSHPRPKPFQSGSSRAGVLGEVSLHRGARAERLGPERGVLGELLGASPHAALLGELFGLSQTLRSPSRAVAWLPLNL